MSKPTVGAEAMQRLGGGWLTRDSGSAQHDLDTVRLQTYNPKGTETKQKGQALGMRDREPQKRGCL